MKFMLLIVFMISPTILAQETKQSHSSFVEFDVRGSQYSSFLGSYFFPGSRLENGHLAQIGLGLGGTSYEFNRTTKAMGLKSALTLQARKEIVPTLSFSQSAFVGYEKVSCGHGGFDADFSTSGYPFYGIDFGFTYQELGRRVMLTTGVGMSGFGFASRDLRSKFDEHSLQYPHSSVSPFIKIGVGL